MKKITKTQIRILNEFTKGGDICVRMASDWSTGAGKNHKRRPLPVYSEEFGICEALVELKGRALQEVKKLQKDHPRVEKVVVITNLRASNKILKDSESE